MPSLASLAPYVAQGVGGLLNRRAAGNATKTLTGGANTAIDTINEGARTSRKSMADIWDAQQKVLDPYTSAGAPATKRLSEGVAPGGDLVKPFNADTFELYKDPGYQWRVEQGQKAIEAGANAGGIRFSGATLKALSAFNQDSASQEYTAARNRSEQDQQKEFDRNLSVSNIGQNATNTEVAAGSNYSTNLAKVDQSTAASVADLQTDLASAQAAGDVAKANSITDTINGILKTAESSKLAKSLAGAAPAALPVASSGATSLASVAIPGSLAVGSGTALGTAAAAPSLSAIAGGVVPELPATLPGILGTAPAAVAPGAGGGLGATLGALATNPFTWVAAGAIGGALLLHHYVGQGRKQADVLTHPSTGPDDPGGLQWGFEQTLKTIDNTPDQTDTQKWAAKTQAYGELEKLVTEFAQKGKNQRKVASRMFDEISHLFGMPNPLKGAA